MKLWHWLAVAVLAVAAAAAPRLWRSPFVTERRAALHLRRAAQHLAANDFDRARPELRAALRLQPNNADARRQLAQSELAAGNWELAFVELESLTAAHPEDTDGWIRLAELMLKFGFLEAPEAALDKVIELAPGNAEARRSRGEIRFRLGRYFGAMVDGQAAVAAAPGAPANWRLLVQSTARSRGAEVGIEEALRGMAALGRVPAVVLPLAGLLTALGRVDEALGLLEGIRSGQPWNDQVARVRTSLKAGDRASARKLVAQMTEPELGPPPAASRSHRPDAQSDAGALGAWTREHWPGRLAQMRQALEAQLRQKNWIEAQRIVEAARRTYPDTAFAAFLAGILEISRDNADEAERHFLEALALAPRLPTVVAALARTWARQYGAAAAGERLVALAQGDRDFFFARSMAARAYLEERDPVQAEAALRGGLELQPPSAVGVRQLADYYFRLDRVPEAMETVRQGLTRLPQSVELQLMLAQLSVAAGAPGDAIRTYQEVLLARPDLDVVDYRLGMLFASPAGAPPDGLRRIAQDLRADGPSDPLLLEALGWILYRAGEKLRARELLEAAVKGAPEEPGPHFHLAAVYAQENRKDLARQELHLALDSPRPFAERLEALRLLRDNR